MPAGQGLKHYSGLPVSPRRGEGAASSAATHSPGGPDRLTCAPIERMPVPDGPSLCFAGTRRDQAQWRTHGDPGRCGADLFFPCLLPSYGWTYTTLIVINGGTSSAGLPWLLVSPSAALFQFSKLIIGPADLLLSSWFAAAAREEPQA